MNGSILIPEEFELNKKTIKVVIDNAYCDEKEYLGESNFNTNRIRLASRYKGKALSTKTKETTYYHELAHFLTKHMKKAAKYEGIELNEEVVDSLGMLLYEYEKSKR